MNIDFYRSARAEELTVMNMDHDVLALAQVDDDNDDNDDNDDDDDDDNDDNDDDDDDSRHSGLAWASASKHVIRCRA